MLSNPTVAVPLADIGEDRELHRYLAGRIPELHLRQRLGIEADHAAWVFGRGRKLIHVENWYSLHGLIRGTVRLALLHGRARRNALAPRLRDNTVRLPRLPRAFDGLRILHLSDLHLDMHEAFPHTLASLVREAEYDLCVITGDFRYRTYGPFGQMLAALARVRGQLTGPVYAVLGNHDSLRMVPGIEALDIRVLLNEAVVLERDGERLQLVGLDDFHYYRADNLELACRDCDPQAATVLLVHTPEFYRHAAHAGVDLMLCGHTHGGQICLPGGIPLLIDADCPRRLAAGPWRHGTMAGYTSVGAGSSIVDLRLNCPPEITVHRLVCGDAADRSPIASNQ